jgi:N-acetylgalactosamine-6-sulfatase
MTGKYPLRFNVKEHFKDKGSFLPKCTTLPKLLKTAGYSTAHVGKWHLGGLRLKDIQQRDQVPGPHEHGFDRYLCQIEEQPLRGLMGNNRILYREGGTCLLKNEKKIETDHPYYHMYLTDILGSECIQSIEDFHQNGQPFFINLWWLTPHTPYEPAPEPQWSDTHADSISDDQHRFRSMVSRMDYQVGQILRKLDELGIADNTLIVFTSDNGGAYEANIGQLKGGKTDLHEGGIRVPFLARWPKEIPTGAETNELGHTTDLLPTFCRAANVDLPDHDRFDGKNILPLLTGKTDQIDRGAVFWQMNLYKHLQRHYPKPEPYATEIVRKGPWKMLALKGEPVELYNIKNDMYEKNNLLDLRLDIVDRLHQELLEWLEAPRQHYGYIE